MQVVTFIIITSTVIICFASFRDSFFGLETVQQQLIIGSVVAATGILAFFARRSSEVKTIPLGDGWWGAGQKPASEDEAVHPFTIQTSDREIQDLHDRIDRTRFAEPLEHSGFQYGFNSTYLRRVVSYWRNEFDWKKQVAVLNTYPHFKTKIEGMHTLVVLSNFFLSFLIFKLLKQRTFSTVFFMFLCFSL
uniref:Epoxide hydrolase N-terminal domain-containing protein n=1 Tax=Oryzias sinensis TaxID=183150 RepID=A0A8C7ZC84_9TELE